MASGGRFQFQFEDGGDRIQSVGEGVAQDYAEALKWYGLSANQGYAPAQTALGLMYFSGTGVGRNYTEAMRWFRLVA